MNIILNQPKLYSLLRSFYTIAPLHIGKTTLCSTIKKDYDMSANELLRNLRLQKAKQLLINSDLPVSEIANMVGVPDYNSLAHC